MRNICVTPTELRNHIEKYGIEVGSIVKFLKCHWRQQTICARVLTFNRESGDMGLDIDIPGIYDSEINARRFYRRREGLVFLDRPAPPSGWTSSTTRVLSIIRA